MIHTYVSKQVKVRGKISDHRYAGEKVRERVELRESSRWWQLCVH